MTRANYVQRYVTDCFSLILMLHYFTITTTIELLCFLVALFCLSKDYVSVWRYFNVFLLLTCITELIGIYLKRNHHLQNAWVYNILMVFEIGFVNLIFLKINRKHPKFKTITLYVGILFIVLYTYDILTHGIFVYNNLTYTVMSVILVIYPLFYYFTLMNNDDYVEIGYSAEFWWVTGALFYYFGETACDLFYDKLQAVYITRLHPLTYYIYIVLNVLLYGFWSYSFICRRWLEKGLETR